MLAAVPLCINGEADWTMAKYRVRVISAAGSSAAVFLGKGDKVDTQKVIRWTRKSNASL